MLALGLYCGGGGSVGATSVPDGHAGDTLLMRIIHYLVTHFHPVFEMDHSVAEAKISLAAYGDMRNSVHASDFSVLTSELSAFNSSAAIAQS